nr:MAG TPA: hypothetical protein [Caudoviricetes sp.]
MYKYYTKILEVFQISFSSFSRFLCLVLREYGFREGKT